MQKVYEWLTVYEEGNYMKFFWKNKKPGVKTPEPGWNKMEKLNEEDTIKVMNRRKEGLVRSQVQSKEERTDYVLKQKEQMVKAMEDMDVLKQRYHSVTDCLTDMQLIEGLPEDTAREIKQTANVILHLKKERKNFQEDKTKLNDSAYLRMEKNQETMPMTIRKLSDDEVYVSKIKTEIDRLEGEKATFQYERSQVKESHKKNFRIAIAALSVFVILFFLLIALQLLFDTDTQMGVVITGICAVIVTTEVLAKYYNNTYIAQKTEHGLNKVIDKQNKRKAKYINAVKGIEFIYAKYKVHSASELLFQWEQFLVTKSARENYKRAGTEIQYNEERLLRLLKEYQVKDAEIWLEQTEYLADEKEMEFAKAELIRKREDVREEIERKKKDLQRIKDDISLLAIKYPEYAEEITNLSKIES